jgi:hypothetical protein
LNAYYLLSGILAVVGGGVVQTLRMLIDITSKWTAVQLTMTEISNDVTELKKKTDDLIWERGKGSAVSH